MLSNSFWRNSNLPRNYYRKPDKTRLMFNAGCRKRMALLLKTGGTFIPRCIFLQKYRKILKTSDQEVKVNSKEESQAVKLEVN